MDNTFAQKLYNIHVDMSNIAFSTKQWSTNNPHKLKWKEWPTVSDDFKSLDKKLYISKRTHSQSYILNASQDISLIEILGIREEKVNHYYTGSLLPQSIFDEGFKSSTINGNIFRLFQTYNTYIVASSGMKYRTELYKKVELYKLYDGHVNYMGTKYIINDDNFKNWLTNRKIHSIEAMTEEDKLIFEFEKNEALTKW